VHADGNTALAESLFREGRELFEGGRAELACEKFDESLRLDPALGSLLNLAECNAHVGRTASAWARFRELAEKARRAGQADREAYAQGKVTELEAKLSYVTLRFSGAVADSVDVDGQRLGRASYSTALPLDPGQHRVAVAAGADRYEVAFTVSATPGRSVVEVPLDAAHRIAPKKPPPVESTATDGRAIAGWVTIGAGLIGVGLGSYFGARALSLGEQSDERCDGNVCDAKGLALYDEAHANADGSTASFVISGAALATGTALLIWVATEGPSAASVSVVGRF